MASNLPRAPIPIGLQGVNSHAEHARRDEVSDKGSPASHSGSVAAGGVRQPTANIAASADIATRKRRVFKHIASPHVSAVIARSSRYSRATPPREKPVEIGGTLAQIAIHPIINFRQ